MHTHTCTYINAIHTKQLGNIIVHIVKKFYILNNDAKYRSIADKNDIRNWHKFLKNTLTHP